jgi:hypothetical protein
VTAHGAATKVDTEPSGGGGDAQWVFIPTEPVVEGQPVTPQLRSMDDGGTALLAYTSLHLLVAGCGPQQAWISAPVEQLETLQSLVGFDVVAVDVELSEDMRVEGSGQ